MSPKNTVSWLHLTRKLTLQGLSTMAAKIFSQEKKVDQERILAHIDYVPMSAIIAKMH